MKAPRTKLPKSEAVRQAVPVKGACLKAQHAQDPVNNGNGKKRPAACWGCKSADSK